MTAALRWGVKESLLRYVADSHGGHIELDGVTRSGDVFQFPLADVEGELLNGTGAAKFAGSLRLFGPFGLPIQEVTEPWVEWDGDEAWLSVVRWPGRPDRLRGWSIRPLVPWEDEYRAGLVQLTADGYELFGQQYTPGTEFDRLSFTLA